MNNISKLVSMPRPYYLPLFLLILCMTPILHAEDGDEDFDGSEDFSLEHIFSLEEIIVTAQKKPESMQKTPISMTVFDAGLLKSIGANNFVDLDGHAPNTLFFRAYGSIHNLGAAVRGLAVSERSFAVDSKTGIYVDGVYIARNSSSVIDVLDLERIELLRGPQGTLWGKNTTGGAINIVTAKPKSEFSIKQQLSSGTDGYYKSVTSVNTPLMPNLNSMFTYAKKNTDGWATNVNSEAIDNNLTELGRDTAHSFRFALNWMATENIDVNYMFDRTSAVSLPLALQITSLSADTSPTVLIIGGPPSPGNVFADMAEIVEDSIRFESFDLSRHGTVDRKLSGHNLTTTWDLGWLDLKSITAYRELNSHINGTSNFSGKEYATPDGTPLYILLAANESAQHQFSQELFVVGSALDETLSFVAGLFYFDETVAEDDPSPVIITQVELVPELFANVYVTDFASYYSLDSVSSALYSHFTYKPIDKWAFTLGVRVTRDEKTLTLLADNPLLDEDVSASKSWNKITKTFNVSYEWSEDVLLYAKRAEGYAAGLYSPGAIDRLADTGLETVAPALIPADPEDLTSYEIGFKSMLMDSRMLFNASLFYSDNDNMQLSGVVGGVRKTFNSGSSLSTGAEIEIRALLAEGVTFNAGYGYTDVTYNVEEFDYFQLAPQNSASAGIQYVGDVTFGSFSFRLDAVFRDKVGVSFSKSEQSAPSRTIFNLNLILSDMDPGEGSLSATLWVRNLTDKVYQNHAHDFTAYTGAVFGDPRAMGIDLIWEY